ncbi:hypothetical protein J6590_016218 [Homalodisca vitripennis]|nr:hypothetical protein J6590_016218 [Homalodisca vitripennis]
MVNKRRSLTVDKSSRLFPSQGYAISIHRHPPLTISSRSIGVGLSSAAPEFEPPHTRLTFNSFVLLTRIIADSCEDTKLAVSQGGAGDKSKFGTGECLAFYRSVSLIGILVECIRFLSRQTRLL